MLRDVFGRVPGTGRWTIVLLADGNIGIGGDPSALLRRAAELLAPPGQALVEIEPPGPPLRQEQVRLCHAGVASAWFPWAFVGADHISDVARDAEINNANSAPHTASVAYSRGSLAVLRAPWFGQLIFWHGERQLRKGVKRNRAADEAGAGPPKHSCQTHKVCP